MEANSSPLECSTDGHSGRVMPIADSPAVSIWEKSDRSQGTQLLEKSQKARTFWLKAKFLFSTWTKKNKKNNTKQMDMAQISLHSLRNVSNGVKLLHCVSRMYFWRLIQGCPSRQAPCVSQQLHSFISNYFQLFMFHHVSSSKEQGG